MSTDAWIAEHWIGEAVLPRPRRAQKLPALPVPHASTCSRDNAALAAHTQSRDSARHPGDGLSARQGGRNVVDQQARKLTQPRSLRSRSETLLWYATDSPTDDIGDQEPEYGAEHDSYFHQPASVHPGWKRNLHLPRTDATVRDVQSPRLRLP